MQSNGGYLDVTAQEHVTVAYADGGLVSTADDLARWFAALFGGEVLPPRMLARMITPTVLPAPTQEVPSGVQDYGYGIGIAGDGFVYNGSIAGYSSDVEWLPARAVAIAALQNTAESFGGPGQYYGAATLVRAAWQVFKKNLY